MIDAKKRWVAAGVAVTLLGATTACSAGTDGADGTAEDPVTIEWWGWNSGQEAQAEAFNAAHDTIQIKYVKQTDAPSTVNAVQNSVQAGEEAACLVQAPWQLASAAVDGLIQPITESFADNEAIYSTGAASASKIGNDTYGIPLSGSPTFTIVNKTVYDANGIAYPETWEDLAAAGAALAPKGISVFNLAGEDPSTLENMAWQAGANWYSIDGDTWNVDFTSQESFKAADILQQLIDSDSVSHESYAQWDSLMQTFDSGTMITIPTSTWQLAAYADNFKNSVGNWKAIPLPEFEGDGPATPGSYSFLAVPSTCNNVDAAVEAGVWLSSNEDSLKIAASPTDGSGAYPATTDASSYVPELMDTALLGSNSPDAQEIVRAAEDATVTGWQYGPNETAMYAELVDQWGKAINKETTLREVLEHMQEWTVADLKAKSINVAD